MVKQISYIKNWNHPIETTTNKWMAMRFQDYLTTGFDTFPHLNQCSEVSISTTRIKPPTKKSSTIYTLPLDPLKTHGKMQVLNVLSPKNMGF